MILVEKIFFSFHKELFWLIDLLTRIDCCGVEQNVMHFKMTMDIWIIYTSINLSALFNFLPFLQLAVNILQIRVNTMFYVEKRGIWIFNGSPLLCGGGGGALHRALHMTIRVECYGQTLKWSCLFCTLLCFWCTLVMHCIHTAITIFFIRARAHTLTQMELGV